MKTFYFLIVFIFFAASAEAKTLYVTGATGNDTTSYAANSEANPWATIGRAVWGSTDQTSPNTSECAQPGDTVEVAAGTYAVTRTKANNRFIPTYQPAKSGTAGNHITYQGQGTVTLQQTGNTGPIIGASNRDYIIWDNFYIDEDDVTTQSDTGPVVVAGSDHIELKNLRINSNEASWHDNHNAIRIENCDDIRIYKCELYEVTGSSTGNCSGITTYNSENLLFEHNEIHDSCIGIYIKYHGDAHSSGPTIIRYNLLYNNTVGIRLHRAPNIGNQVYQNVIWDTGTGIVFQHFGTEGTPNDFAVVNNTLDNCGTSLRADNVAGITDNRWMNNIITNSTSYAISSNESSEGNLGNDSYLDSEHNCWYNWATFATVGWSSKTRSYCSY